jgi:hypothetical protein
MPETNFENLRMSIMTFDNERTLSLCVESGHVEYEISLPLNQRDCLVMESDMERAAFLQAALHQPYQLKETDLSDVEQRQYLDVILHSPQSEVEDFLTKLDHGRANGAISNMVRITSGRDCEPMRNGRWFKQ